MKNNVNEILEMYCASIQEGRVSGVLFTMIPDLIAEIKDLRKADHRVVEAARSLCISFPSSTPADFADLYLAVKELDAEEARQR